MPRRPFRKSFFSYPNLTKILFTFALLAGVLFNSVNLNNPVTALAGGPFSSSSSTTSSTSSSTSTTSSVSSVSSLSTSSSTSSLSSDYTSSNDSSTVSSSSISSSQDQSSSQSSSISTELKLSQDYLEPLDPTLNHDKTKDRFNIVFFYTDYTGSLTDLKTEVSKLVLLKNIKNINPTTYGAFNIEPYKSNIDKFNFWFYNKAIPVDQDYVFEYLVRDTPSLGIDYITPIRLTYDYSGRSNANYADIGYNPDYSIKTYYNSSIRMYLNNDVDTGVALAHELAHALFGLADEYVEPGNEFPRIKYPNCAPDLATATQWWGSLKDQVDPYFYEYRQALIDYYTSLPDPYFLRYNNGVLQVSGVVQLPDETWVVEWTKLDDLNVVLNEEDFRIGFVNGDCFSTATEGAVRPMKQSAMSTRAYAIYGSVNRREMQKIMDMFSGQSNVLAKRKPDYLNPEIFEAFKLTDTQCQIKITLTNKKLLTCSVKNGKPLISRTNIYKIGLVKYDQTEFASITDSGVQSCRLSADGTIFNCDPIDITNIPTNLDYTLLFFFEPGPNSLDSELKYPSALPMTKGGDWFYDFKLDIFPVSTETAQSSSTVSSTTTNNTNTSKKTAIPVTSTIIAQNNIQTTTLPGSSNSSSSTNSSTSKSSSASNSLKSEPSSTSSSNPSGNTSSSSQKSSTSSNNSNNNLGNILLWTATGATLIIGGYFIYKKGYRG
ncbi:MAG: hypothetical protein WCK98_01025 [bacterium]